MITPTSGSWATDRLVRLGTGPISGTYYQVGKSISAAISNPEEQSKISCENGGSCGVQGLIAVVQASQGSMQNIQALEERTIDLAFSQTSIAFWAYTATQIYKGQDQKDNLRAIAYLFPEEMHVLINKSTGIQHISDLNGLRVAMGSKQSGTLTNTRIVLNAYGLKESDIQPFYLGTETALDHLIDGKIDALFNMTGAPALGLGSVMQNYNVTFLPVAGKQRDYLTSFFPHFMAVSLPTGTYPNTKEVETISVGALLLAGIHLPDEIVYEITKSLWHPLNQKVLLRGHPKTLTISKLDAVRNIPVPLHKGAAKYYAEAAKHQSKLEAR